MQERLREERMGEGRGENGNRRRKGEGDVFEGIFTRA